jgi:hypothetical protein
MIKDGAPSNGSTGLKKLLFFDEATMPLWSFKDLHNYWDTTFFLPFLFKKGKIAKHPCGVKVI